MRYQNTQQQLQQELADIQASGLWKHEHPIASEQKNLIQLNNGREVINMCANNYLGLANNPEVIEAAQKSYQDYGFGLSSVRFICGTQTIHKQLEQAVSDYLYTESTILYAACFDANTGLFETLLDDRDAVISDQLNHASIIDGIRLCKAKRYRYNNNDMADLEQQLKTARQQGARRILITTDGVFSMDGTLANLAAICDLADQYEALVHHDDCHAVGFMGANGRGMHEHCQVIDRVDIITGTFGKALGGASGGYTSGRKEIIDLLRQRSRPYLFSNTLAPAICAASLKVLEILSASNERQQQLKDNTYYFRQQMSQAGFSIPEGEHPIVPIMLGDAKLAQNMSKQLLELGIYAVGFFYPVVPKDQARIRTQISAIHSRQDLDNAVTAFTTAYTQLTG